VDVYTYLSSSRLLTAPAPVEKMRACMDLMRFAWRLLESCSRMGLFLFFLSVIHLATSLCDQYSIA